MINKKNTNEIDLFEIFKTIRNYKKKIFLIVSLTVAVTLGFQINKINNIKITKNFTTEILPISIFEELKYKNAEGVNIIVDTNIDVVNNNPSTNIEKQSGSDQINKYVLLNLFITTLLENKKELIEKFNFIKREDYESEAVYKAEIHKIASLMKITTTNDDEDSEEESPKKASVKIEFSTDDMNMISKWVEFVNTIEDSLNKSVQKYLQVIIKNDIENANSINRNEIEDIDSEIKTALKYYELEMNSRISFLKEQAKIAREGKIVGKLDGDVEITERTDKKIKKSENLDEEIIPSNFGYNYSIQYAEDGLLSLYYLKGYRVIEKEIELINKRKNRYLFAKSIPMLETKKLKVQKNQTTNRREAVYKKTPIFSDNKFLAAKIQVTSMKELKSNNLSITQVIVFAILIGLMFSIFYVYISRAFHNATNHDHK